MREHGTPSIIPNDIDDTVYMVVDCYGRSGCVWREADVETTDLETVIADLMTGQYTDPLRVIAFNTTEGWSRDVSADIARELQRRADLAYEDLSSALESFVEMHAGRDRQLTLRLGR